MKLPFWGLLAPRVARRVAQVVAYPPDFVIGADYLLRWWLTGGMQDPKHPHDPTRRRPRAFLGFRVYLHMFLASDDDRAHHDHPTWSISFGLGGAAIEHTIDAGGVHRRRALGPGMIRFRSAKFAHRIEIPEGGHFLSLFIFGPSLRKRTWGFHCPNGWVPWQEFTAADDPGAVGRGCGEHTQ